MADSRPTSPARRKIAGFTAAEFVVAAGISGFVLAGVAITNLQLLRSSFRLMQYSEMDTQVRRSFEQLGVDLKAASTFTYNSASDITVTVAKSDGTATQYTYAWNSTTQVFYRVPGTSSSATSGRLQLATGVASLAFSRFDTSGNATSSDSATKRVKIALKTTRSAGGGVNSSATEANTYTLRNKPAS